MNINYSINLIDFQNVPNLRINNCLEWSIKNIFEVQEDEGDRKLQNISFANSFFFFKE